MFNYKQCEKLCLYLKHVLYLLFDCIGVHFIVWSIDPLLVEVIELDGIFVEIVVGGQFGPQLPSLGVICSLPPKRLFLNIESLDLKSTQKLFSQILHFLT